VILSFSNRRIPFRDSQPAIRYHNDCVPCAGWDGIQSHIKWCVIESSHIHHGIERHHPTIRARCRTLHRDEGSDDQQQQQQEQQQEQQQRDGCPGGTTAEFIQQ